MIICIPTMGKAGLDEKVHGHFGSAHYFAICDTEKNEVEMVPNGNTHHEHGACQPLQAVTQYNVGAVIAAGMGRRAIERLMSGGITVYRSGDGTVRETLEAFKKGSLAVMAPATACQGHSGGHGCH